MNMDERGVVAEVRRVSLRELRLWVREGWVQPAQSDRGPVFDEVDVAERDGIEGPGVDGHDGALDGHRGAGTVVSTVSP